MKILVVGSVALDSVKTPFGEEDEILGGSATFFSIAASFFNPVSMIATVGEDFPEKYVRLLRKRGIDTSGIVVSKGKTFRWKGRYDDDLNTAHTIYTHLNVFKDFEPKIPASMVCPKILFLANIDPDLQISVLKQVARPRLIACDSMNFWISNKRRSLERLLPKIDLLLLNDGEARLFSGESNIIKAAKFIVSHGPKSVIIKRGEFGVVYFSRMSHFIAPAYLLESLMDPTGAGDSFAGGMIGSLSRSKIISESSIRNSIIYGSVVASFTVEGFGARKLLAISKKEIESRYADFRDLTSY